MSTDIVFPQTPFVDITTGEVTLEWRLWLLNPQVLTIVLGTALDVASGGTGLTSGTSGGILGFTSTTTMASSAALGANQIVLGGGAGFTPSTPVGLGTTTTLLHGNAAGAPFYAAVSLVNDVTGTLQVTHGGTNSAVALSGSTIMISNGSAIVQGAAGTGSTVLHGNASGAPTYSQVDLTTDITGNLPVSHLNNGTGAGATTYWRGDASWANPLNGGISTTITTAPLTGGGTTGSMTFSNGLLTASTPAT